MNSVIKKKKELIFSIALTGILYIIVFSFIISEGVVKSGLAEYTAGKLMNKIVKKPKDMILFSYIAGILLIFFIPLPFPRVILLSAFYVEYLKKQKIPKSSKSVFLFSIYTAATFTSMLFLNGDLLLHFVAMRMGNSNINWAHMKMGLFQQGSPILTFIIYTVVNMHYLLPFHHATIMVGYGEDFYDSKQVIKYGLLMTVITFISVIFIEVPWWRLIGGM